MWYFAWFLGLGFAVLFAVVNALWFEAQACAEREGRNGQE
ncbi:MAG: cytochrome bd-I oxidase subunit CydX [Thiobacillaceae bacterium]|nr:cytochrome bd-I oxidase subunit CydX [Thiobacillaceae bacterium]MDW8324587.1 cytochrome bd-I oxidase subunit CydX [Burkholderiales bacterium]